MAGRLSRIAIACFILWALWVGRLLGPAVQELPAGTVLVSSSEELDSLEEGNAIAIEGKVYPAELAGGETLWKERFAYRLSISRKSEFGANQEVVTQHIRPAIRLEWAGPALVAPADSYRIEFAPEAPGDSVLLTTEENVGFRLGDEAVALGRIVGDGRIVVEEFGRGPLAVYLEKLAGENTARAWIWYGFRGVGSLFALFMLVMAFRRAVPISETPPRENANS